MKSLRRLALSALASALIFFLAACATGGGDAASSPPETSVPAASPASDAAREVASGDTAPSSTEEGAEEDGEMKNTIRWMTASEVENFGFDVYRSESEEGPFEVLTKDPLEGGGTVDEPREYVFVDDQIEPEKVYFYYVESISMSGVRERFTPVVKAKAKRPPAK